MGILIIVLLIDLTFHMSETQELVNIMIAIPIVILICYHLQRFVDNSLTFGTRSLPSDGLVTVKEEAKT